MRQPIAPTGPLLTRRQLLAAGGAGALLAALPLTARANTRWQNWSGSQSVTPAAVHYPASADELAGIVRQAKAPIRAFGGSHSFNGLVPSPGTLVSLEQMSGLVAHDAQRHTATLGAGTRIAMAGELLAGIGQNFHNEPDINMQSLGGAISTATHGTGRTLKCLSGYVERLTLVLADGSVVTVDAERDRDLFEAARVGIGALGIITEITIANRPAYRLAEDTEVMSIKEAMQLMEARRDIDRHIEFFAFPHGGTAIVKRMNITDEAVTPVEEPAFDENVLLELAADTAHHLPFTKGVIQKLVGSFVTQGRRVAEAHRMFPNVRAVPFNEMEYTVPADQGLACLEEVIDTIRKQDINVFFPIEFRYTAADDTWLSPFSERAGASLSIHQYHLQDYRELFAATEPVLRRYQGRPHWGKIHTLGPDELRTRYPKFDAWLDVRRRVDPQGRFLNDYLRGMLGIPA
jgi:FAD-linked oxidoreductase